MSKTIKKRQTDKIGKEFLGILIRGSLQQKLKQLPTKTLEEYYIPRFDFLKKKYGYRNLEASIPTLLDMVTLNPIINLKHQTEGTINLAVVYEPLEKYYDEMIGKE